MENQTLLSIIGGLLTLLSLLSIWILKTVNSQQIDIAVMKIQINSIMKKLDDE